MAISFIDLGLVDTSLVARDEEDDDADNDVVKAAKDRGVKVRHVLFATTDDLHVKIFFMLG